MVCVLQDCKGRVAELLGICADDIKLSQLEEFPGTVLVMVASVC